MFGRGYFRHAQARGPKANRNRRRHMTPLSLSCASEDTGDLEACKRLAKSLCVGSSPNPSSFAMFVQLHAQESTQELAELFESLNKAGQVWDSSMDEDPSDKKKEKEKKKGKEKNEKKETKPEEETVRNSLPLPKMVALGITGVLEVISATQTSHPDLCLRVLEAFHKIVSYNEIGALENEPLETITPLFQLLLEMVQTRGTNQNIASLAASSLIGLILSLGKTDMTLQAVSALMLSQGSFGSHPIPIPEIMRTLQRSVNSALCGRAISRDTIKQSLLRSAKVDTWTPQTEPLDTPTTHSSLSCSEHFLFLRRDDVLLKLGTGYGDTLRGHIYNAKTGIMPANRAGWLGFWRGKILFREVTMDGNILLELSADNLEVVGEHRLPQELDPELCLFYSSGEQLGTLEVKGESDVFLHSLELDEGPDADLKLSQTHHLTVGRTILMASGSDDFLNIPQSQSDTSSPASVVYSQSQELPTIITVTSKSAAFLSQSGQIFYTGCGDAFGTASQTGHDEWVSVMLPDESTFRSFSLSHSSTFCAYIDTNAKLYLSGVGVKGLSPAGVGKKDGQKQHVEIPSLTPTQLPRLTSCCSGWSAPLVAVISEEGDLYVFGEMLFEGLKRSDDGKVKYPEGVTFQSVCLGDKHALTLSAAGKVYSFGQNSKGECGVSDMDENPENNEELIVKSLTEVSIPDVVKLCRVGARHSLALSKSGDAFVWGSNDKGQLGIGDKINRRKPVKVALPAPVIDATCGEEFTVFLLADGRIYGAGLNINCVLGLPESDGEVMSATPLTLLPGQSADPSMLLLSAGGSNLLILQKQQLLSNQSLREAELLCEKNSLAIVPSRKNARSCAFSWLKINLRNRAFSVQDQDIYLDCSGGALALDHVFGNVWHYDSTRHEISQYNGTLSSFKLNESVLSVNREPLLLSQTVLSPSLCLPNVPHVSRVQAALNLLTCQYCLLIRDKCEIITEDKDGIAEKSKLIQQSNKDPTIGYSVAHRFGGFADIWYHDGSADAVMFQVDKQLLLGGLGVFSGSNGTLRGQIQVQDSQDKNQGPVVAGLDNLEIPQDASGEIYAAMFDTPYMLDPDHWYTAHLKLEGAQALKSGKTGKTEVLEDGVNWSFKYSDQSHNGTDTNSGQLPTFYFKFPKVTKLAAAELGDELEEEAPVQILDSRFYMDVSPQCFESLIRLLEWLCTSVRSSLMEISQRKETPAQDLDREMVLMDIERQLHAIEACLKHCDIYFHKIYPKTPLSPDTAKEMPEYVDFVLKFRQLLRDVLFEPLPKEVFEPGSQECVLRDRLVKMCQDTFISCFSIFYPTPKLKYWVLCEMLLNVSIDEIAQGAPGEMLLVSVLEAIGESSALGLSSILRHSQYADTLTPFKTKFPLLERAIREATEQQQEPEPMNYEAIISKLQALSCAPAHHVIRSQDPEPVSTRSVSQAASNLLLAKLQELSMFVQSLKSSSTLENDYFKGMRETAKRFSGLLKSWQTVKQDAIAFEVNRRDIWIYGFGVYAGKKVTCEFEMFEEVEPDRFNLLEKSKTTLSEKDSNKTSHIANVMLSNPVCIQDNRRYHLVCSFPGIKKVSFGGKSGQKELEALKGLKFTFFTSKFSESGTNCSQGQIPSLLYSHSGPSFTQTLLNSREDTNLRDCSDSYLKMTRTFLESATRIIETSLSVGVSTDLLTRLGNTSFFSQILPELLVLLIPVAKLYPEITVEVMHILRSLLTEVSLVNRQVVSETLNFSEEDLTFMAVESDHPYPESSITPYNIAFPPDVKWMLVNFSPECATCQPEDTLKLTIPHPDTNDTSKPPLTILGPFSEKVWPTEPKIVKGNRLSFIFEAATDYLKEENANKFGFKCDVIGFPWDTMSCEPMLQLERLLHYIGALCASSLVQSGNELHFVPPLNALEDGSSSSRADMNFVYEIANSEFVSYKGLLEGGLRVNCPTVDLALKGEVVHSDPTPALAFIRDFIEGQTDTSGGRLSAFLQTESSIDYTKSRIHLPVFGVKSQWPSLISATLADRKGREMYVNDIHLEITISEIRPKQDETDTPADLLFKFLNITPPKLEHSYSSTILGPNIFTCISCMEVFQNFSLEELRFTSIHSQNEDFNTFSQTIKLVGLQEKKYIGRWTPLHPGKYKITLFIEGVKAETIEIDVESPEIEEIPPVYPFITHQKKAMKVTTSDPDVKNVKIYSEPDTNSAVLGQVPRAKLLYYFEELLIENKEGNWIRLRPESLRQYAKLGTTPTKGYSISYVKNKDTVTMKPEVLEATVSALQVADSGTRRIKKGTLKRVGGPGSYEVTECGEAGHLIRSQPANNSTPVGFLARGSVVQVSEEATKNESIWLKLEHSSMVTEALCNEDATTYWVLGVDLRNFIVHLRKEGDDGSKSTDVGVEETDFESFDFKTPTKPPNLFNFAQLPEGKSVFQFEAEKEREKECKTPLCDIFSTKTPEEIHIGLSPDYARCQRTIYSAYMWQEGLLVDAMAASAYIKFNPNTPRIKSSTFKKDPPKQEAPSEEPEPKPKEAPEEEAKPEEEKEKSPEKPEKSPEKPKEIEVKEEPVEKKDEEKGDEIMAKKEPCAKPVPDRSDTPPIEDLEEKAAKELREKVPVTLRYLINFWDFLMDNVTEMGNTQINIPPLPDKIKDQIKAEKEVEKEASKKEKKKPDDGNESICELCDESYPNPVTYHMKVEHPGCKQAAKGWGYNSNGSYCSGWAGNCGDGGSAGSTWYIMCETCHTDYMQDKHKKEKMRRFKSQAMGVKKRGGQVRKLLEKPSLTILEENTQFLLELQSPKFISDQELSEKGPPSYSRQISEPRGPRKPSFKRADTIATTNPKSQLFSRTISMDINKEPEELASAFKECPIEESGSEVSPLFLTRPSPVLTKLISKYHREKHEEIGCLPDFLKFISNRHDLEGLRVTLQNKLCISRMRVYSLDYLDWLLKVTTDATCLHDTLWHFMSSFYKIPVKKAEDEEAKKSDKTEILDARHPTELLFGSTAVKQTRSALYELLTTIAELLPKLPIGSAAQEMAVRAWCIPFQVDDHGFIHNCSIFPHISHILSLLEEATKAHPEAKDTDIPTSLFVDEDVTSQVTVTVSSREAMLNSLTDNSTETFWESGEECKFRSRSIYFEIPKALKNNSLRVCVYIDHVRDTGCVSDTMSVMVGENKDKKDLSEISNEKLSLTQVGWLSVNIPLDRVKKFVQVALKGTKNASRVRQVKLIKSNEGKETDKPTLTGVQMQLASCENQTLRLFRALTSQIFGTILLKKSSESDKDSEKGDKDDIREQLVGILEENRLSKFQIEMCAEIVKSVIHEFNTMKTDFSQKLEDANWSEVSTIDQVSALQWDAVRDAILHELLTMLMALAQSELVAKHLSKNASLMKTSFHLLHVASKRCQLLVIELLSRLLEHIAPEDLAKILNIEYLPTNSTSIATLVQRPINANGILDYLLLALAKSLEVQIRSRGGEDKTAMSISLFKLTTQDSLMELETEEWMWKGAIAKDISNAIVTLLKEMYNGKMGEQWKNVCKACVAQAILMITKVKEPERTVKECRVMKCFWLFMGALCVLDEELCGQLSSGGTTESKEPKSKVVSMCINHDDDQTKAVVECDQCGTLCAQCDLYLHLPKTKRDHKRVLFKEEEEAMKVDLHEGCGRTKLYWLMSMVDTNSLKSMAEFRGQHAQAEPGSGGCRFCDTAGASEMLGLGFVCDDPDCQERAKNACRKALPCGHMCGGVKDEKDHLPCLHGCEKDTNLKQDGEDMCMVCYTDSLFAAPSVKLKCGHLFHFHCTWKSLETKWHGPRILFRFLFCSICQTSPLEAPQLEKVFRPMMTLYEKVKSKAMMRLEYENKSNVEALTDPKSKFYQKPGEYSLDRYAYYQCFKCNGPYYGGEARCLDAVNVSDEYDPSELVCGGCSNVTEAQICPRHGTDYLEYKCRYCCSIASYFCFGTTHFCSPCHDDVGRVTGIPKDELPSCPVGPKAMPQDGNECPLRVKHPPTGEEFALGCGICRNAQSF